MKTIQSVRRSLVKKPEIQSDYAKQSLRHHANPSPNCLLIDAAVPAPSTAPDVNISYTMTMPHAPCPSAASPTRLGIYLAAAPTPCHPRPPPPVVLPST